MRRYTRAPLTAEELADLREPDVLQFVRDVSFVTPIHWDRKAGVHVIVQRVDRHGNYVEVFNTFSGRRNVIMNDGAFGDLVKLT
jgi:hypothetical protein